MKSFPGMKKREVSSIWLLAPLIAKLPDELHQHIHNQATVMLEMGTMFNADTTSSNVAQVSQQGGVFVCFTQSFTRSIRVEHFVISGNLVFAITFRIQRNLMEHIQ